ncbi:hypothetical protein E9229_002643 [Paeniglutamicibacter cryotolerans]|uniref:Uncharacterized protein n=1 Tax=Paeniglutamicibacter cryotolerans TaxID=670079 RepID=A0A839QT53_9MICC|nr:hypothetical protein [Paeniglutamicibacter cryotolerans]
MNPRGRSVHTHRPAPLDHGEREIQAPQRWRKHLGGYGRSGLAPDGLPIVAHAPQNTRAAFSHTLPGAGSALPWHPRIHGAQERWIKGLNATSRNGHGRSLPAPTEPTGQEILCVELPPALSDANAERVGILEIVSRWVDLILCRVRRGGLNVRPRNAGPQSRYRSWSGKSGPGFTSRRNAAKPRGVRAFNGEDVATRKDAVRAIRGPHHSINEAG